MPANQANPPPLLRFFGGPMRPKKLRNGSRPCRPGRRVGVRVGVEVLPKGEFPREDLPDAVAVINPSLKPDRLNLYRQIPSSTASTPPPPASCSSTRPDAHPAAPRASLRPALEIRRRTPPPPRTRRDTFRGRSDSFSGPCGQPLRFRVDSWTSGSGQVSEYSGQPRSPFRDACDEPVLWLHYEAASTPPAVLHDVRQFGNG